MIVVQLMYSNILITRPLKGLFFYAINLSTFLKMMLRIEVWTSNLIYSDNRLYI